MRGVGRDGWAGAERRISRGKQVRDKLIATRPKESIAKRATTFL